MLTHHGDEPAQRPVRAYLGQAPNIVSQALLRDAIAAEERLIPSAYYLHQAPTHPMPDDEFGAELIEQVVTLRAYARRLAGSAADADDLLQDTMLRCWTARASFTPGTSLIAWGRTIMRNRFLTGRRRARFQADMPGDAIDRMLSVTENQENVVDLRDVGWALTELAPDQREAVLLAGEGVSMGDAADRLGIPEGTFKSRVARGRTRLRLLTEEPGTPLFSDRPTLEQPTPDRVRMEPPRPKRDWTGVMIG